LTSLGFASLRAAPSAGWVAELQHVC